MVSLGNISSVFTTWFRIASQTAAAAAAAGTASQQHVQPQASDEKTILYIVDGMIANTTLVASSTLPALQMDALVAAASAAAAAAAAATPSTPSSGQVVIMYKSAVSWQQLRHDISNHHNKCDDDNHNNSHTTALLLYVVHGNGLWQLKSPSNKWTLLAEQVRGFASPSTLMARSGRWLVSCCRQDECICFDTRARISMYCPTTTKKDKEQQQFMSRGDARIIPMSGHYALVHGAKTQAHTYLCGLLLLDLSNAPHLVWYPLEQPHGQKDDYTYISRASLINVAALVLQLSDDSQHHQHHHPLVRRAPANDSTTTRTTAETETETKRISHILKTPVPAFKDSSISTPTRTPSNSGLNGGAIVGIVVGVCAFLFIAAGLVVWKRRQQRSKLHYFQKQHHPSARFSLSTTPPSSRPTSTIDDHCRGPGILPIARTASVPETNMTTRISTLSLDSDLRHSAVQQHQQQGALLPSSSSHTKHLSHPQHDFSTSYSTMYMPGSRHDSRVARNSLRETIQKQDMIQRPDPLWLRPPPSPAGGGSKRGSRTSVLRRLTLNISSALGRPQSHLAHDTITPTALIKRYTISDMVSDRRRSSGMLLGGGGGGSSSTGPSRFLPPYNEDYKPPRMSMSSSRSVSSVQWVGFNDQMDYKEQHWDPTVQLAVTNQMHRHSASSSSRTNSVVAAMESRIGTPRQSTPSYRLSTQVAHSWEDMLYHQRTTTRSSSSLSLTLTRQTLPHLQYSSVTSLPSPPPIHSRTAASLVD